MTEQGEKTRWRILDFIDEFVDYHGYSPSYSEIQRGTGIASSATVFHHLTKLEEQGALTWKAGLSRTIRLT